LLSVEICLDIKEMNLYNSLIFFSETGASPYIRYCRSPWSIITRQLSIHCLHPIGWQQLHWIEQQVCCRKTQPTTKSLSLDDCPFHCIGSTKEASCFLNATGSYQFANTCTADTILTRNDSEGLDEHAITHVIHLAALQLPFVKADPPLGARVNVVGTVNVFEAVACRKERIERIIYASSAAVYDAADAGEPGAVIQHSTAGHPTSLYGVFKQANEGTARIYWQDHLLASIGLRPATVYGPGRDQGITSAPTKAMFAAVVGQPFHIPYGGRGEFQYADDVAKAFIACARTPFEGAEIFNLHGSVAHMSELVAEIETAVPESREQITFAEPGFPSPEEFDATALTELIGTLPHTPLREGVAATIALFREKVANGEMAPDALLH
jgi:UDP-glucuronate 4-epimerase